MSNQQKYQDHWSYSMHDTSIGVGLVKVKAVVVFPAILTYLGMPFLFMLAWIGIDIFIGRTGFTLIGYYKRWRVRITAKKIFGGANRNKINRLNYVRSKRGLL